MTHPIFARHPAFILSAAMAAVMSAAPALAAQSSAYAVSADLTTDGSSHAQLAPQLLTAGTTALGQSYNKPKSAAVISKALRLLPASLRGPTLTVLEERVATNASGSNLIDAQSANSTSGAASGIVSLVLYPSLVIDPPPIKLPPVTQPALDAAPADDLGAAVGRPFPPFQPVALRVQFSKLRATASYAQVFRGPSRRSGSASFNEVTLSGPLVGPKPLSFSGDIEPNTVVVNTPTVKITLNAQVIPQQPVCKPDMACPQYYVLETVETKAIQIELTNAPVLGHQVSGQIVVGEAQAGQ